MLLALLLADTLTRTLAPLPPGYVDGYASTVRGQRFTYQSAHPTEHASLLVRSVDSNDAAVWLSAPVPGSIDGTRHVAFLAAMDVTDPGQTPVRFWLTVNGSHRVAIPQPTDTTPDWSSLGDDGIVFHFHRLMVDRYGDLHGVVTLDVPAALAPAGKAVNLRVQGEDAGRQSWFILYTVSMQPTVSAHAEQMLARGANGPMQTVRFDIWDPFDTAAAMMSTVGTTDTIHILRGATTWRLAIPAVQSPTSVAITIRGNGISASFDSLPLAPVIPRDVYLIDHNHLDIGYTDIQTAVRAKHERSIDSALVYIDRSRANPPDARFRWNVEGLWQVEHYLATRPATDTARLLAAARRGDVALSALYANLMTGLSGGEELVHVLDFARTLRSRDHVPIVAAMSSDVPGYTWGLVPALASQGVRYLSSGPNESDRIGYTLKDWGDKPFWWIGPSGRDSLLVMFAGHGYSWVYNWPQRRITVEDATVMSGYMDELAAEHYPWDIVQVRVAIGGDNGVPDGQLADVVRQWNAHYISPHLVIATLPQMFTAMEKRYGKALPRIRGDLTGYWEDGAVSSLREEIENRNAAARVVQATTLAALRGVPLLPRDVDSAWRNIVLWDEHTWGADVSISDPDSPRTIAQWKFKEHFALAADSMTRALLVMAATPGSRPDVDIWNTDADATHAVVRLDDSLSHGNDGARDGAGRLIPSQRLSDGSLAVSVTVPSMASTRIVLTRDGRTPTRVDARHEAARAAGDSLWNGLVTVHIDRRTGAISSLRWRSHELVDTTRGGLGRYRYLAGRDTNTARDASNTRMEVVDSGPLVATLRITSNAPGARSLVRDVTLESASDAVALVTHLDKLGVRDKESVHIAFPFEVPDGVIRMEQGWAVVRPDSDQATGANRNLYPVQRWLDVSNAGFGVTVVTPDLPLWELNGLTAEAPFAAADGNETWLRHALPGTELIAYAMNNYWHTNYKADQPGPVTFRVTLIPHGAFDASQSTHAALDVVAPPTVMRAREVVAPQPPFTIDNDSVIVSSIAPSADGKAWMVRLWNPSSRAARVSFLWKVGGAPMIWISSPSEERGDVAPAKIEIPAMGVVTVRVESHGHR